MLEILDVEHDGSPAGRARVVGTVIENGGGEQMLIPEADLRRVDGAAAATEEEARAHLAETARAARKTPSDPRARRGLGMAPEQGGAAFVSHRRRAQPRRPPRQQPSRRSRRRQHPRTSADDLDDPDVEPPPFDWCRDESIVLNEQRATAIYFNPRRLDRHPARAGNLRSRRYGRGHQHQRTSRLSSTASVISWAIPSRPREAACHEPPPTANPDERRRGGRARSPARRRQAQPPPAAVAIVGLAHPRPRDLLPRPIRRAAARRRRRPPTT